MAERLTHTQSCDTRAPLGSPHLEVKSMVQGDVGALSGDAVAVYSGCTGVLPVLTVSCQASADRAAGKAMGPRLWRTDSEMLR